MKIRDLFKYENNILEPNWDFIESIEEFKVLKSTKQSNIWHKEGDVWEHTKLVTNKMIEELTLNDIEKTSKYYMLMVAAAICHDLGKGVTTVWDKTKNDWTCPFHGDEGAKITRKLFFEENVDFREKLCSMVRWHMTLHHIFDNKEKVTENLIDLSQKCYVPMSYMLLLNYCDSKGSINEMETDEVLFNKMNEIENICLENDIFDKTYKHFDKQKHPFTVFVMVGLPGSGKDTYIKNHLSHLPTVSRDDIRIEMGMKGEKPTGTKEEENEVTLRFNKRMIELCEDKQSFVINNTNVRKKYRDDYKKMIMKYNPYIIYVYVETPSISINKSRREGQMPLSVIDRMIDNFDYPLPSEYNQMLFDIQDEYKKGVIDTKIEYVDDLFYPKQFLKNTINKLISIRGAMVMEGYDEEESCINYITNIINDLENELY